MAIKQEKIDNFIHTYSDAGFYILQIDTGIEYADAMDLMGHEHKYSETDHLIEVSEDKEETEK